MMESDLTGKGVVAAPVTAKQREIRILGARLLIKRLPLPETTESGLYILGREHPCCGEVLALGTGIRKKSRRLPIPDIEVGDKVTFQWRDAFLDTRQVAPDTFILDYEICQAGMREVDGKMMVWPLGKWLMVSRRNKSSQVLATEA